MTIVIETKNDNNRTKVYRWLQRHKAFYWMVDGKNYSSLSKRVIKSTKQYEKNKPTLHTGLGFAESDGKRFYIDTLKLEDNEEMIETVYKYLKNLNKNNGIFIRQLLPIDDKKLDWIFGKREIFPDCEECNLYKLFQLKKKEHEQIHNEEMKGNVLK